MAVLTKKRKQKEGSLWESLKFLWTKCNQFNLTKSTFDILKKMNFVDNKVCAHSPFMVGGLLFSFFPFLLVTSSLLETLFAAFGI